MKDFVSVKDHSREELVQIIELAHYIKSHSEEFSDMLRGKILATLFYEPSTRTQLSFQSAMLRLGGQLIGFSGTGGTSVKKGESLTDTIHMAAAYADAIVLRHPARGSARLASTIAPDGTPVISAGAGSQNHPTQAMLDLMTIWETQGRVTNLDVGITGDLRFSRTIPSLLHLLGMMGDNTIKAFAHPLLQLTSEVKEDLGLYPLTIDEYPTLEEHINDLDILYFTRIQRERFPDPEMFNDVQGVFSFVEEYLGKVRPNFKLLHPLPRVDEIPYEVDRSPHAYYFQQAKNGVYVRMALLLMLLVPDRVEDIKLPNTLRFS